MAAAAHLRRLRETLDGPVTLGELASRLGREGIGLLLVILAVPFLQPIPLAGLGTPIGFLVAALGVQLARGRGKLPLPRFAAEKRLDEAAVRRALEAAERLTGKLERWTKPRWSFAARRPMVYGLGMIALGLLFALPIFVPLGNPLTGAAAIFIGFCLLEDDGLLGVLGLAGTCLSVLAHSAFLWYLWKGGAALLRR
jgi:hypothetical protein